MKKAIIQKMNPLRVLKNFLQGNEQEKQLLKLNIN